MKIEEMEKIVNEMIEKKQGKDKTSSFSAIILDKSIGSYSNKENSKEHEETLRKEGEEK